MRSGFGFFPSFSGGTLFTHGDSSGENRQLPQTCPMMEPQPCNVTLGISSAGEHRDGFTSAGKVLEKFPGVLPLRCHGAGHCLLPVRLPKNKSVNWNLTSQLNETSGDEWSTFRICERRDTAVVAALETLVHTPPGPKIVPCLRWLPPGLAARFLNLFSFLMSRYFRVNDRTKIIKWLKSVKLNTYTGLGQDFTPFIKLTRFLH